MRTTVLLPPQLLHLSKLHEEGESFTPGIPILYQKHWITCDNTDGQRKNINRQKWTKTSRDNIMKQRKIAPHNQQQNQSEVRLGKVKRRTSPL